VPTPAEAPRFALRYPRAGLPAVVAASDSLIAHVRLPSALTPPPGVQQLRALEGWRGELVGHAVALEPGRALEHRYALEVVDVRPYSSSSLDYRVKLPIPAWTAPGTYDFVLAGPGGSARVASAVRVLARGSLPRLAWLAAGASLSSLAAAALPVDVFVSGMLPAQAHPLSAPVLVPKSAVVALRWGKELLVVGDCPTDSLASMDEARGVLVRERRTRRPLPEAPELGPAQLQIWGRAAQPLPAETAVSIARIDSGLELRVATRFPAELSLLVPADGRGLTSERSAPSFFPASSSLRASPRAALIATLRVAAPGTRVQRRAQGRLQAKLVLTPSRAVVLEPVRAWAQDAPSGSRLALRIDHATTHFARSAIEHRFGAVGMQTLAAWVIAPDGRASALEQRLEVRGALAAGCSFCPARPERPVLQALLLVVAVACSRKRLRGCGKR
jgi:hypothetical protein